MECEAIQYMRPSGERVKQVFSLPDEYEPQYKSMMAAGCHFAAEVLIGGMISITIENDILDVDGELISPDPDKVLPAHTKLLERERWLDPRNLVEPLHP